MYTYEFPGLTKIHGLYVWGISPSETALTTHLIIPQDHPGNKFETKICQELHNNFSVDN